MDNFWNLTKTIFKLKIFQTKMYHFHLEQRKSHNHSNPKQYYIYIYIYILYCLKPNKNNLQVEKYYILNIFFFLEFNQHGEFLEFNKNYPQIENIIFKIKF